MTDPLSQPGSEVILTVWQKKKVCERLSATLGPHLPCDPNSIRRSVYKHLALHGIHIGQVYEDTLKLEWDSKLRVIYAGVIIKRGVKVERTIRNTKEKPKGE